MTDPAKSLNQPLLAFQSHRLALAAWIVLLLTPGVRAADPAASRDPADPLAPWRGEVKVKPVSPRLDRHAIHSYFNTTPESPDGRWVVYYSSQTRDGHVGEVRILERATGREKIAARNVTTEDAHRAACQQWVSNGRRVVFHDFRGGEWVVAAVDIATLQERVLATGRQLSWGRPDSDLVPLYGPHWDPDAYRDLEILNVETGERRTALTMARVRERYPEWFERNFPGKETSIFFPILSPDLQRVLFKIASPAGGHFRSREASIRQGLVGYDLARSRFLFIHDRWGHPAWHPDSKRVINVGPVLIDSDDGTSTPIPGLPKFRGSHPSISPDGKLFTTEALVESAPEPPHASRPNAQGPVYGIVVGGIRGGEHRTIHTFDHSRGAASWRPAHPHPIFSPDGRRIYFNVSSTEWTQLYVAEPAR